MRPQAVLIGEYPCVLTTLGTRCRKNNDENQAWRRLPGVTLFLSPTASQFLRQQFVDFYPSRQSAGRS